MISPSDKTKCILAPPPPFFFKLPQKLSWTMYTFHPAFHSRAVHSRLLRTVTLGNRHLRTVTLGNVRLCAVFSRTGVYLMQYLLCHCH